MTNHPAKPGWWFYLIGVFVLLLGGADYVNFVVRSASGTLKTTLMGFYGLMCWGALGTFIIVRTFLKRRRADGQLEGPPAVYNWNWGAFWLNWIWGIGNRTYTATLLCFVPVVNLAMPIVMGINGNKWAWKNKQWDSAEHFRHVQMVWTLVGFTLGIVGMLFSVFYIMTLLQAPLAGEPKLSEAPQPIEEAPMRPSEAPVQTGREITGLDGAPMMLVPAGEFLYADNNQRRSLPAFYMDKYEVTTSRYAKFLQATGHQEPALWNQAVPVNFGDRPVVAVTWHDAVAYCRWAKKRLPTEQEWEKAARGTDGRKYPWGNDEPTSRHANFNKFPDFKNYGVLTPVGSFEAGKSPYGIYDLAGNVWEWTASSAGPRRYGNYDLVGILLEWGASLFKSHSKVIRGGSWGPTALSLRSSDRGTYFDWSRSNDGGFRCAQHAPK